MKRKIVLEIIYVSFLILWAYAAFSKLFAFTIFKTQLGKSPLLHSIAPVVAIGIPLIEIGLAVMLVVDRTKKMGLIGSGILMLTFTLYLIGILNFSTEIPCSCGGLLQELTWRQHIYLNFGFILLALFGMMLQSSRFKNWLDQRMNRRLAQ